MVIETIYREKVQWYFKEIDSKNMLAENIKNEEIMNIKFEGFIMYS
jgi:hypothetical protein